MEMYESARRRKRRARKRLLLNAYQRRDMLWRAGYELDDIDVAAKAVDKQRFRRSLQLYLMPIYVFSDYMEEKVCFCGGGRRSQRLSAANKRLQSNSSSASSSGDGSSREGSTWSSIVDIDGEAGNSVGQEGYISEADIYEQQVRDLHRRQLADMDTAENGGIPPWRRHDSSTLRHRPLQRRVSFRGSSGNGTGESGGGSQEFDEEGSSEFSGAFSEASASVRAFSVHSADVRNANEYNSTGDSNFSLYHIRTDPRQHDKAIEIILCSARRPHMRAFHASWFGFFIGFIMWFAITPLLGETKEILNLTNSQIWTSSMAGTAVTVLARVLMGPLCDVFGARRCMAAIVIVSAIPCGLTGLVNSAAGLAAVRALTGIAGSAFVPCQYWTSRMVRNFFFGGV